MLDRRELLGLAAAVAATGASAAPAPVRKGAARPSRASEIRALRTFAEATHPRGREARDDPDWQRRWARLEHDANRLPDGAYFVEARRALAWFEDGHTTVVPFEYLGKVPKPFADGAFGLNLPWKVKVFDDGAYVVAAPESVKGNLGARIERVGALSSISLIRTLDSTWPGNRAWTHNWAAMSFVSPGQLQGLGALIKPDAPLPVALFGNQGTFRVNLQSTRETPALTDIARQKFRQEVWAAAAGHDNYVKVLPEQRAIYVSIDDMDDEDGLTFDQFTKQIFSAMQSVPDGRLILDLRRNGGGDNYLAEPLRKHVERSMFNRPGRLFVLVGRQTFSAAQNLANRLERETFAIFIGEPTGLSPNHYGDAKLFTGKATGMVSMVSTLPWFDSYPQDKRPWIMPDLPVPRNFEDWRSGRDPALEAALSETFVGVADDSSRDRVFFYNRASQKTEWKPFWA